MQYENVKYKGKSMESYEKSINGNNMSEDLS